jgi:hypothetical protein
MRNIHFLITGTALLFVCACAGKVVGSPNESSGDSANDSASKRSTITANGCPAVGNSSMCSGDAPFTQADIDSCTSSLSERCGAAYKQLLDCSYEKQTCTADDKSDKDAGLAACATELSALKSCVDNGG